MECELVEDSLTLTNYSINEFITNIIKIAYANGLTLFGGAIRSFILGEFPNDLDFAYASNLIKTQFLQKLKDSNYWIAEIEGKYNNKCSSYAVIDLNDHKNGIHIDLVYENSLGKDPDFDVNSLRMKSFDSIEMADGIDIPINTILENIHNRTFNIIKSKKEFISREENLVENSLYLIRFIKMQTRTAKMLSNRWQIGDKKDLKQNLEQHFYPLLIKENRNSSDSSDLTKACSFCEKKLEAAYILELDCCQSSTCDLCLLDYIKTNFDNPEIVCPFCLGDPCGLKTVQPIEI
jgi:hypothetical protein